MRQLKVGDGKYKIWKDRFDDYAIGDVSSVHTKINYIHLNPVRKGLVEKAEDYQYSSAAFYLLLRTLNSNTSSFNIIRFSSQQILFVDL